MNNMKSPIVTVLMSVYNNEKTVSKTIHSILNQTFSDYEFLIINDASTDNTIDVVRSFSDSRVRIIDNSKNLGLTRSLNSGLGEAKGQFIARIDADDISLPDRLKKQIDFLRGNPEFVLLGTSYNIINNHGDIIKKVIYNTSPEKLYYDLTFQNMFAHSSAMFKLDEVMGVGGYSESYRYAQDYDLWCKLVNKGRAWALPDVLTLWCSDPGNISSRRRQEQNTASLNIFKNNLRKIGVSGNYLKNIDYLHNFYADDFIKIPSEIIHRTFNTMVFINNKLINNTPAFYSKSLLKDIAYSNIVDLLTRIYKNTGKKKEVLSFFTKNILNMRLVGKVLKKLFSFAKKAK